MKDVSLSDEARTAIAEGLPVFVARLPVAAPFQDARALPEWSRVIAEVENQGWTLHTMSIGQDSVIGVQGYLVFRR